MRYGIITFHNTLNCGACLQAYALCKFLRNNGVDCDILDYQCNSIVERELKFKRYNSFLKTIIMRMFVWPKQKKMNSAFIEILQREKMLSNRIYTPENIIEANDAYDGFITGSDQVMNLNITKNDYNYFLKFATDDKRKIAFSASIGEKWEEKENNKIQFLLNRYEALSFRECSDCEFINAFFCKNAIHVCDPTMLLTQSEWKKIATPPSERGYVLLYNPRSGIDKIAERYAAQNKKKLILIGTGRINFANRGAKTVKPSEWIGYIQNADVVFTDSYHGLLFSLYFNKPVWTLYSGNRCSRQSSLYEKLDIYDCVYVNEKSFNKNIDYAVINLKMENFRKKSLNFLLEITK